MTDSQVFLSDKGKAAAPNPQAVPKDGFFTQSPSTLKMPLVSTAIMDFEQLALKMDPTKFEEKKTELADFIESVYGFVRKNGYADPSHSGKLLTRDPQDKFELLSLCKEILPLIWGKYSYDGKKSDLLANAIANGTLDCDTSSFVLADILNQFGVKSRLVALPKHAILKVSAGSGSFYLETTTKGATNYANLASLEREYARTGQSSTFCGECGFSAENFITYNNRGLVKSEQGDYKGAIEDFNKSISLNIGNFPWISGTFSVLGQTRFMMGDYKGAIKDCDRAISLNPSNTNAYGNRGYFKLKTGDYKGAIMDSGKAISLNPKHAYAYNNRGGAKCRLGYYKEALEDCNTSLSMDPKNAYAYLNRGDAKLKLNDKKGAKMDYTLAAWLFEKQGMVAEAKDARVHASKL
ncbi:MAG: tetratricopeptide repeat protein [Candidatus Micrarchaeota archaeon]|nr:tetratricopeptide repeat protein [Candidatus Micrarchaeota archaeon]